MSKSTSYVKIKMWFERIKENRKDYLILIFYFFIVLVINYLIIYLFQKKLFTHIGVIDDVGLIDHYGNFGFKQCFIGDGYKYRPLNEILLWLTVRVLKFNIYYLGVFNYLINALISTVLFFIVRKNGILGAICLSLLYDTSRFAYYQLVMLLGIMEASALIISVVFVMLLCKYIEKGNSRYYYISGVLFFLCSMIHERYAVLIVPMLGVLLFEFTSRENRKIVIKRSIFTVVDGGLVAIILLLRTNDVLMGTDGQSVRTSFSLLGIVQNFIRSIGFLLGLNSDEEYLSGIWYRHYPLKIWILVVIAIIAIVCVIVIRVIDIVKISDKKVKEKEIEIDVVYLLTIGMLLAISSSTIRVEMRWMFSPYVVMVIWMYRCSVSFTESKMKRLKLFSFYLYTIVMVVFNSFCMNYVSNTYYWSDYAVGDKLAKATYGIFKDKVYDYKYVVVSPIKLQDNYEYKDVLGQFDLNREIDLVVYESVDQVSETDCQNTVVINWNGSDYDVYAMGIKLK